MSGVLAPERVAALGFCPDCYATGATVLVVPGQARCRAHLFDPRVLVETARGGQTRLTVPAGARRRIAHPTGVQTPCVPCAAAGRDIQGMPRDGDGSEALCIPCWRGRADRREAAERPRLVAELRQRLQDADAPQSCAACGEPEPVSSCWLCGYSWLAQARADHEHALAVQAHAQALADAAVEQRFAQIAQRAEAEQRVAALAAWIDRLTETLAAFHAGDSWGRPVWQLADLLARDAAARVSRRGRRSALGRVCAVLAVNADRRSGRRAMPGRADTAVLAGCGSTRPVTDAWRRAEALGWHTRTEQGRRLSFVERCATGRGRARTVFDITALHQGPLHRAEPAVQTAHLAAALDVMADLAEHARTLLAAAQDHADELHAGGWVDYPEQIRRRQMRQAVAAARDHARHQATNFRTPHTVSQAMSVYSSLVRGYLFLSANTSTRASGNRLRRRNNGASRSPRSGGGRGGSECGRPPHLQRPRPIQEPCAPPRPRRRPSWTAWAYDLAQALTETDHWRWLRDAPLPRIAATLGATLGPEWTAGALTAWIRHTRTRPLLANPTNPTAYLRAVLEDALTTSAAPPHPARRHTEHRRRLVTAQAATAATANTTTREQWAAREQARQAERDGPGHSRHTALAVARAATRGDHTAARTIAATTPPARTTDEDWPHTAQPGSGLPAGGLDR